MADVAQFTPKTVETQVERQKLMFRIKAHLKREMLERYIDNVKTGLPGVAWVKLDDNQPWPKELDIDPVERERIQKLYEETQKNAVPLKSVLSSQTQEAAHSLPLDRKTLEKAKIDAQDMTKEKAVDMEIKLIKQIDGKKKGNIEQDVKAAKDFNKKDQTVIDKNVEVIKQVNEAAQKAKINGDKK